MMRKAIVRATVVENIVCDPLPSWTPPVGTTLVDDPDERASIGGSWDGNNFLPPPDPPAPPPPFVPFVGAALPANIQNTTVNFADAVGLSFAVLPNQAYVFEFDVVFRTAALTTGLGLAVTAPASPLTFSYQRDIPASAVAGTDAINTQQGVANDGTATSTAAIDAANTDRLARVFGILKTGANGGTLQLRFKSEVANSAVTIREGSVGRLWAVK